MTSLTFSYFRRTLQRSIFFEVYNSGKDGTKEKTTTNSKMGGVNYSSDGCNIGRPERPDWKQIVLEKVESS